MFRNTKVFH